MSEIPREWKCLYAERCLVSDESQCYDPKQVVECYLYEYFLEQEVNREVD